MPGSVLFQTGGDKDCANTTERITSHALGVTYHKTFGGTLVGKEHKKDKTSGKDKKHKKDSADAGSSTVGNVDTGAYSDGHPQDAFNTSKPKSS